MTCILLLLAGCLHASGQAEDYTRYAGLLKENLGRDFRMMYREAGGVLPYPFLTAGSEAYADCLWDWDSWLSNIALRQILHDRGIPAEQEEVMKYERGCILNSLAYCNGMGWIPIIIARDNEFDALRPLNAYEENTHKPCLTQHAAFLVRMDGGDAEWLREDFAKMQYFMNGYRTRQFHRPTGLYFWINDVMIGVDNDPGTFYRPARSSGSIYLNCMMYKELLAMSYLAGCLGLNEILADYNAWAEALGQAVREHCWDERDGFYYNVDLNLTPVVNDRWHYHQGAQRHWECLIQRIDVWSGFMALWSGIATPEQAERMVRGRLLDDRTFNSPYGVRTLSKLEKMYNVKASGNPSSWLGPIWGISNYMTWKGVRDYGFEEEARELAAKTIVLFGRDIERTGELHEYYQPDNGEPILNKGSRTGITSCLTCLHGWKAVKRYPNFDRKHLTL